MLKLAKYSYLFMICAGFGVSPIMASAQDNNPPSRQELSLVAGYKSMFTCSATFNGGKAQADILVDELKHIYSAYEPLLDDVGEADIDRKKKTVSVSFAADMPPRISAWREHLGCTALPQGADESFIKKLPRIALSGDAAEARAKPWPIGDALPDTGELLSQPSAALDPVVDAAFGGEYMGRTSAVVIVKDGQLIAEHYKHGHTKYTPQRTWSVAKSIAASVIGVAVKDKLIKLDEKTGLAAWSRRGDPRQSITLENLLHMNSGLHTPIAGNRTDQIYLGGGLVSHHATRNPLEAPPGKRWNYSNNDTMLAMRTLREHMGHDKRYWEYPFKKLLHKIGMHHTYLEMDWNGDYVMSSQVWTTGRDLARLGLLYLNDGEWDGKKILPENWSDYVSTLATDQPNGYENNPEAPGRAYGAQFWLYKNYEGVPNDTYAALGNRGQFVIIVPSRNIVIVRRGYDYRGNYFDGPKFTADVLAALQ
ncbi:MAG: serine hydrolase [Maricaulaceae bacterium]